MGPYHTMRMMTGLGHEDRRHSQSLSKWHHSLSSIITPVGRLVTCTCDVHAHSVAQLCPTLSLTYLCMCVYIIHKICVYIYTYNPKVSNPLLDTIF